jgi:hypothetical protein
VVVLTQVLTHGCRQGKGDVAGDGCVPTHGCSEAWGNKGGLCADSWGIRVGHPGLCQQLLRGLMVMPGGTANPELACCSR